MTNIDDPNASWRNAWDAVKAYWGLVNSYPQ